MEPSGAGALQSVVGVPECGLDQGTCAQLPAERLCRSPASGRTILRSFVAAGSPAARQVQRLVRQAVLRSSIEAGHEEGAFTSLGSTVVGCSKAVYLACRWAPPPAASLRAVRGMRGELHSFRAVVRRGSSRWTAEGGSPCRCALPNDYAAHLRAAGPFYAPLWRPVPRPLVRCSGLLGRLATHLRLVGPTSRQAPERNVCGAGDRRR